jgi:enoyl-CoA hydratase/carnithine racemase
MGEQIATEVSEDGIATLTLNRPDRRNALSIQMREEISNQLEAWAEDQAVRVVVITGASPAFCAGFDLDEFAKPELADDIYATSRRYHLALWSFAKPTIAAINGAAFAGGFDLTVLCDLRIAARSATFAHPEIKFGAPPLFTPLQWIVGQGLARDLLLTGRRLDADEAARIGLVSRVVDDGALLEEALATARTIAEAPQPTLEATKRYLVGSAGATFEQAFAVEHDGVFETFLAGAVGPRQDA